MNPLRPTPDLAQVDQFAARRHHWQNVADGVCAVKAVQSLLTTPAPQAETPAGVTGSGAAQ